jgi:signal transduction histidine kinase/ligand-binding sensor domain-containing protein
MRALYLACIVLAWIASAGASEAPADVTGYLHTSFDPGQGAPAAEAAVLAQTSDGFLWVGTTIGLYRFDGVRFERIRSIGGVPLLGEVVTALEAPQSGGLWIGYLFGGASFLKDGVLRNYPAQRGGLPEGTMESFAVDADGAVWAATTRGMARFAGDRWTDLTQSLGLPSPSAIDLVADTSGNLWFESSDKVAVLPRGASRVRIYPLPPGDDLKRDYLGRVWIMGHHPNCLFLLEATRQDAPPCRRLPDSYNDFWLIDRTGNAWGGSDATGVSVLPTPPIGGTPGNPRSMPFADGAAPIASLMDREGNIWFGTTRGLEQFRIPRLREFGPYPELVVLGSGNHDSMWVATTHYRPEPGDDFFHLKNDLMAPYRGGPTMITASYRDPTGVLWMGGYGRLWKLNNDDTWEEVATPSPALASIPGDPLHRTQAIGRDSSGTLWLSVVRQGLFRLRNGMWQRVTVPGIPESDYPISIHLDGDDSLWLGYIHGRLAVQKQGVWHLYDDQDGINIDSIETLSRVNGQLWLGGERGVQRMQGGRFESIPGLSDLRTVSGLLQAKNGDTWLNTASGAMRVSRQALAGLDAAPPVPLAYETFDTLDGMPGVAAGIRPLPSILESDDGFIWFEAEDRFASLDPGELASDTIRPEVVIETVTDDGRQREAAASLPLFPNVRNTAIDYTATSLSIPRRVQFKYRLDNFDRGWQDVGSRRAAYYNNLPPGRYVFHVIAANERGVWNTQGATMTLMVPALFYQTLSFRIGIIALGFLLLYGLTYFFIRQSADRQRKRLEQRMEDRLNERSRIARELHDSLLQGFHGLMFRLEAVRQLLPERAADASQTLSTAMQLGDQAMLEGRDAVEDLRSSWFGERDLPSTLAALGAELGSTLPSQSKPEFRVVVEGQARALNAAVRDDTYRIVREAVRNAYQHAHADTIEAEIRFGDRDLSIRVRDDGSGVDAQVLARGQRPGHWGLPGMRERSERLGGHFHVWSEAGAGTEVELRLPADVAYMHAPPSPIGRLRRFLRR